MRRIALVLILGFALVTAGCLGGGDDSSAAGGEPADTASPAADNGTADNETDDAGHAHVWNETTKEGTVEGANLIVGSTAQGNTSQSFDVPEESHEMWFNVSADGELQVEFYPPGCERSQGGGDACATTNMTEDGELHWNVSSPDPGAWTVYFFPSEAGAQTVNYEVTANILETIMTEA